MNFLLTCFNVLEPRLEHLSADCRPFSDLFPTQIFFCKKNLLLQNDEETFAAAAVLVVSTVEVVVSVVVVVSVSVSVSTFSIIIKLLPPFGCLFTSRN
jgi:hypothetical protein